MKNARKLGVAVAAAAIGFGLLGATAPAHAMKDTSWGMSTTSPATGPVVAKTPVKLK